MRITPELNPTLRSIRTRHINFVSRNPFALIQNLDRLFVIGTRVPKDIREDHDIFLFPERRKLFREKRRRPNVLQPNSIQHPRRCLINARRRFPRHRFFETPFDDTPAEPVKMHNVFKFDPVAERARSRDDRILQLDSSEAHTQVWLTDGRHCSPPAGGVSGTTPAGAGGAGALEFEFERCAGCNASVSTLPVAAAGALIPSKDASVTARSTGSACVR